MKRSQKFAVLETNWHRNDVPVRPIFAFLREAKGNDFFYERFFSSDSLAESLKLVIRPSVACIYLGAHGTNDKIEFPNGDAIGIKRLSRLLQKNCVNTDVRGLYLDVCEFGTKKHAEEILKSVTSLVWVCGYDKPCEWFRSITFSALFFACYLDEIRRPRMRSIAAVHSVAERLRGGLSTELGFNVFVRNSKRIGGIRNFIQK